MSLQAELAERQSQQTVRLLRIYNYYRLGLGIALVVGFANDEQRQLLGATNPDMFAAVIGLYVLANLMLAVIAFLARDASTLTNESALFAIVGIDVLALLAIMFASGGISSGLAPLTLVAIGAGAILLTRRFALLLPAIAAIAVLYAELGHTINRDGVQPEYFQAAILGALYLATSLALRGLAARLRISETESLMRALEVQDLERLSDTVIQRMRTGILVVNQEGAIRMANSAARQLMRHTGASPNARLPTPLLERLNAWRSDTFARGESFQAEGAGPEVRANFSSIRSDDQSDTIVFLEDQSEVQQQAQQLKLAGLGRLSASIAHEIRNPLGAISHAAQLLGESPALSGPDLRLAQIVQDHCRRMNTIIANMLELSRRGQPNLERIKLQDWVMRFAAEYCDARPEAAALIAAPHIADITVQFDPGQLGQVITNLLDNALRYCRNESGSVRFEGGIDPLSERPFLLVADDGPGVAAQNVPNLFEPFFTTDSKGTGLGLYISRELCEANQARLSYVPALPSGSCFRIAFAHSKRVLG